MEQPEEPVESQDIDSSVTRSPLQWTLDVTDSIEVDASQDEAVTESAPKKVPVNGLYMMENVFLSGRDV
jgi:hypothetical protein